MAIILASQSPRRRELLGQIGIRDFVIRPAQGEEDMELDVQLQDFENYSLKEHIVLHHENLKAVNTAQVQAVAPRGVEVQQGKVRLQKQSWNMLRYCRK